MTPIQKRFLLFLVGCMGTRVLFTLLAKNSDIQYLPILGYIALLPAFGFFYIYVTGSRKTAFSHSSGSFNYGHILISLKKSSLSASPGSACLINASPIRKV